MADYRGTDSETRYSDAPEVVSCQESEVSHKIPAPDSTPPEVVPWLGTHDDVGYAEPTVRPARKFWQRKRIWVTVVVATLSLVALVIGLAVGLVTGNDTSNQRSDASDSKSRDAITFCDTDKFCRTTIHATEFDDKLYLFARSNTNQTVVRTNDGSKWDTEWENLGAGGDGMISPPTAMGWKKEPNSKGQLDVVAVGEKNRGVYRRGITNNTDQKWHSLNPNAGSQLILCTVNSRLHIWSTDANSRKVAHNWWQREDDPDDSDWYSTENKGEWQQDDFDAEVATGIGLVCREKASSTHDVAWYEDSGGQKVAKHQQWNAKSKKWQEEPETKKGNFIGDPFLYYYTSESEKVYFFGVQDDGEMYYYAWMNNAYSSLMSLGGAIASSPTIISVDNGSTSDMFSLGLNKTLQYLSYNGTDWADEWRDLGIEGRSAPTAQFYNNQVLVFMIGKDGKLISITYNIRSGKIHLDEPGQADLGGNLSNKGYYG